MSRKVLFTSESVTEGHPDKICDQISDAILDAIFAEDPNGRVACETTVTTGQVHVFGEITTTAHIAFPKVIRDTIRDIGYTTSAYGFDADSVGINIALDEQSPDIAMGVDKSLEAKSNEADPYDIGAGDQGMMFGYASNETPEYLPMPIALAHRLARRLAEVRKSGELSYLRPDGKTQVTILYEDGKPVAVDTIVISTQHDEDVALATIRKDLIEQVIKAVVPADLLSDKTRIFVNPTGKFVIGGPQGDSGLTGRKIIVDTYGGYAAHGGGAFSGKDPTKVDRSAAYMARYVAKNLVAAGLAKKCQIELAYAIGVAHPVSVLVESYGTGKLSDTALSELVQRCFDLRPASIIKTLDLRRPIYQQVAAYGHFGRSDLDLPWEKTDAVDALLANV